MPITYSLDIDEVITWVAFAKPGILKFIINV